MNHAGVDNLLWARASKLGQASWCEGAKINHKHFSKGYPMDSTYLKGWSNVHKDREKLKEILLKENLV